ncbi:prolyl 3-hydroxylase 1 isoform X1 [Pocillopora verrucosa]|uniref:prolyl 3-hydroxylase 1 isoform X1 n=1 Tax=Pocillopora verrucosa TaxID=203993 RepID=UPI003340507B
MAARLLFWLSLCGLKASNLRADLLGRLNITALKSTAYDELFADGQRAYRDEKWNEAIELLEKAIADYRNEKQVKIHCRLRCRERFQASSSHNTISDLELNYYRYTIYSHKCSQQCREKYLGKRTKVSVAIRDNFEKRLPYGYLQFAYYKAGRTVDAARAAYTCTETQPQDKAMADNVKIYKQMPGVAEAGIFSLEPTLHQESYFNAARLYEEEQWSDAIQGFEQALEEYYTAYDNCKIMCEEEREKNKILGRSGLFGVHVDILECRNICPDKLREVKGIFVKNYLARHYNYLQMAYFKVGKLWDAAGCAASYLLLDPDDDTMIDNLRYFKQELGDQSLKITARKAAIQYFKEASIERKLLQMAKVYMDEADFDDSDTWFHDGQDDEPKEQEVKLEDLVEGEETYTVEKLWGLGPIKKEPLVEKPDDVVNFERYKGSKILMTEADLNGTWRVAVDGMATEKECKMLIKLAEKTATLGDGYDQRNKDDKPFSFTEKETFSGVTILSASKAARRKEVPLEEVELYFNLSDKVRQFTEDYFQLDTPLYFSYSHLVCRTSLMDPNDPNPGFHLSHPIHSDNCLLNLDGLGSCPKRSPAYTWRDFSALLYLNGDFKGGEFLFANPDDSVQAKLKPECGRAVAFSAGLENLHGVAGIREGRRCALALWFTLRKKHDEQLRKVAWETFQMAKEEKRLEELPLFKPEVAAHSEL